MLLNYAHYFLTLSVYLYLLRFDRPYLVDFRKQTNLEDSYPGNHLQSHVTGPKK